VRINIICPTQLAITVKKVIENRMDEKSAFLSRLGKKINSEVTMSAKKNTDRDVD
jgi:hypothetical protein